jgi:hypothetical protein
MASLEGGQLDDQKWKVGDLDQTAPLITHRSPRLLRRPQLHIGCQLSLLIAPKFKQALLY